MRDFEITWIRRGEIPDLDLSGVPDSKAYISESEALSSEDFKKARREGLIEVKAIPFSKKRVPPKTHSSPISFDMGSFEEMLKRVLSPIVSNQEKIIELLESRPVRISSPREKKENGPKRVSTPRKISELELPDISPEITFAEVSFENVVKQPTSEDDTNSTIQSIGKLKQLRKKS